VFRVQVQEAKVPPGDRLKLIEIGRHFTIRLGDFAQDFPQGLHLLAELPHVVLEVAFAHAHSPSNRRGLKSPHFPSGFAVVAIPSSGIGKFAIRCLSSYSSSYRAFSIAHPRIKRPASLESME